ncbi:MAG TPA: hypothetical protein VHV83_10700 [Armatimonadota bacterium]|nr:hypothetical protein [Armatimonadota bacterium]
MACLLSLLITIGIMAIFHLMNRPFSKQYQPFLSVTAVLVVLFSGAVIVLDMVWQWKTLALVTRGENDYPVTPLTARVAWRVLRANYRILFFPGLSFVVLYAFFFGRFPIPHLYDPIAGIIIVMDWVLPIASIMIVLWLSRSHLFVTSALLAGSDLAKSYPASVALGKKYRAEMRILLMNLK